MILCKKRIQQVEADAQHHLGEMYGKGEGVEKNLSSALEWYRRAAELGHIRAQHALQNKKCLYLFL